MKIKFHVTNNWKEDQKTDIALTPCLYIKPCDIDGVRSYSLLLTWLRFSIGFQLMWLESKEDIA